MPVRIIIDDQVTQVDSIELRADEVVFCEEGDHSNYDINFVDPANGYVHGYWSVEAATFYDEDDVSAGKVLIEATDPDDPWKLPEEERDEADQLWLSRFKRADRDDRYEAFEDSYLAHQLIQLVESIGLAKTAGYLKTQHNNY